MEKMRFLIALIVCIFAWFIGCSPNIDSEQVEGVVQEGFVQKTGIEVESVSCPKDIPTKANSTHKFPFSAELFTKACYFFPRGGSSARMIQIS